MFVAWLWKKSNLRFTGLSEGNSPVTADRACLVIYSTPSCFKVRSSLLWPPLSDSDNALYLSHYYSIYVYVWLHVLSCHSKGFKLTVYPKKYAHGFVVLCFVVVMQSFIMNSHEVFIHIHQGCFAGTGAIVRLPQCQWSKLDGYGIISQCITTTKHSKAKTACIFLGIYCKLSRDRLRRCPNVWISSWAAELLKYIGF